MRKTILSMTLAVLVPTAVLAAPGPKMRDMFTPEQQAAFMLQNRDQLQALSPDQRKAWRQDQMAKIAAMSDADRAHMKADLQAKWDALPQAQKDRIEQRIAARGQQQQ